MKTLVVVLFLTLSPNLGICAQENMEGHQSATVMYELYSWRDGNGEWCFSILTMTNRAKTAEDIFNQQRTLHGIGKLKERISKMRGRSELVWMKNPWEGTSVKGTESVAWPPENVMNEVKRFAATKHVQVVW